MVYRVAARYCKLGVIGLIDPRTTRGATKVTPRLLATLTRLLVENPSFSSFRRNQC